IYEDLILQHTVIIEMSDSYLRNEWAKSSSDTSLVPLNNQQNYAVDETMNMNPNLQHIYMSQISAIQPQFGGRNQVWTSPDDVPPKTECAREGSRTQVPVFSTQPTSSYTILEFISYQELNIKVSAYLQLLS
ncbi:unnamed protein product, partial [Didymodactylos carnosus]